MKAEIEIKLMFNEALERQKKVNQRLQEVSTWDSKVDQQSCAGYLLALRKVLNYWSDKPFKF